MGLLDMRVQSGRLRPYDASDQSQEIQLTTQLTDLKRFEQSEQGQGVSVSSRAITRLFFLPPFEKSACILSSRASS